MQADTPWLCCLGLFWDVTTSCRKETSCGPSVPGVDMWHCVRVSMWGWKTFTVSDLCIDLTHTHIVDYAEGQRRLEAQSSDVCSRQRSYICCSTHTHIYTHKHTHDQIHIRTHTHKHMHTKNCCTSLPRGQVVSVCVFHFWIYIYFLSIYCMFLSFYLSVCLFWHLVFSEFIPREDQTDWRVS